MTANEIKAREIIDQAFRYGCSWRVAQITLNNGKYAQMPQLTKDECLAVAQNYPHSIIEIASEFGGDGVLYEITTAYVSLPRNFQRSVRSWLKHRPTSG